MGAPPEVVLLDCDGVLRHWDREHFVAAAADLGLAVADLAGIAFAHELLRAAMTGGVTAEGWAAEIGRRAAERHSADADAVAAAFLAMTWRIDEEMIDLVRAVRSEGRARVAMFSNASTRLEADLESSGIRHDLDAVVNSARIGLAKPDPAAFRRAAAVLRTWPSRCLFVDDRPENVVGARRSGMRAVRFESAEALRGVLVRERVLGAAPAA